MSDLDSILQEALVETQRGRTVLMMFDDMYSVNDHFQAVLEWFKEHGNRMRRRYGQGAYLQQGMIYFVGADTHVKVLPDGTEEPIQTRGVAREFDLRPFTTGLVRKTGLEARLREKLAARSECCGEKDRGGARCEDCPA